MLAISKLRAFVILVCLCIWAISAVFFISWLVSELSEGYESATIEDRVDDHELRIRKLEYRLMER